MTDPARKPLALIAAYDRNRVIGHEGGTLLVVANGLRLLGRGRPAR